MQKHILLKEAKFDFGTIQIIDNIVIAEMNEGIVFNQANNLQLLQFCHQILGDRSYGYISNRTNSYTIDPTVYIQASAVKNIEAIAVVCTDASNKSNASVEKIFFDNPFETFDTLDQAKNWIHNILD